MARHGNKMACANKLHSRLYCTSVLELDMIIKIVTAKVMKVNKAGICDNTSFFHARSHTNYKLWDFSLCNNYTHSYLLFYSQHFSLVFAS